MAHSICEYLRVRIRDFLATRDESLRWLSRQSKVDYSAIYRLHAGDQKSLSFGNAYKILKFMDPASYLNILGEFYPDPLRDLTRGSSDIDAKAAIASAVLRDFSMYRVLVFASASSDTSRAMVAARFGTDGLEQLDKLIALGALAERSHGDGLVDLLDCETLYSDEALRQYAKFNVDIVDLLKPCSTIQNIRTGLNDRGLVEWYNAATEFKNKLHAIDRNADLRGPIPAVASVSAGPI
jgi:hypothetical protein